MFTGLVQDLGLVESREVNADGARLRVRTRLGAELEPGDSIAVDGACLTAVECDDEGFSADVMRQTLSLTTLGGLEPGARVNLEPAARLGDRLGGHLVQGHVDGVAEVSELREDGIALRLEAIFPPALTANVIDQGSVTLNGVSLTITRVSPPDPRGTNRLEVSLIPETRERTNLGSAEVGTRLNMECDVIARYLDRYIQTRLRALHKEDPEPWKPDG